MAGTQTAQDAQGEGGMPTRMYRLPGLHTEVWPGNYCLGRTKYDAWPPVVFANAWRHFV